MFCREQVTQLRDKIGDIRAAGAELIVLGNGTVEHARWLVDELDMDSPVVTDPSRAAYAAVGAKRSIWRVLNPVVFLKAIGVMARGFKQTEIKGDALQLGGVFVIRPDGSVPYVSLSGYAGDHPDPAVVLAALKSL